jgi:hypothetical protein
MRIPRGAVIVLIAMGIAVLGKTAPTKAGEAKAEQPRLRVGVFDSRAVALAYGQATEEPGHGPRLRRLMEDYKKAKAAGDAEKVKRLETQGRQEQDQLHQQVFSTGSVANLLDKIKDQLPGIAKDAGVDLIVSKWDMVYQTPGSQTVDITQAMVRPFHPSPKTLRGIQELEKVAPMPLEEAKKIPTDK